MRKISFLLATAVLLSVPLAKADGNILVELKEEPGQSSDQRGFDLIVTSTGEVTLTTTSYRLNYVASKSLANLSEDTVIKLQQLAAQIPDDAGLIDLNAEQPPCANAPTSEIAVFKNNQLLKISTVSQCHEMAFANNEASRTIVDLVRSLLETAKLDVPN